MCSAATQTVIEQVVKEKVSKGDMFTAFDVTVDSKKRGVRDRHRDVKHVVHDYFSNSNMPGYSRTLLNVGGPIPAFVYHAYSDDPNTYGKTAPPVVVSTPSPVGIFSPNLGSQTAGTQPSILPSGITAKADARGTVCIPKEVLKKVGLVPFQRVAVYADNTNNYLVIADENQVMVKPYAKRLRYTVDYHGNVRITTKALKAAGIQLGLKGHRYAVDSDGVNVTLRN